ncbi:hypothetical protein [Microbacterium sp. APC 3901]|nr:hypothetical protein [Microbacterium sp. APC 3901]MDN3445470.1 hypothetical protein [Microbacterium sp. APC 3901]
MGGTAGRTPIMPIARAMSTTLTTLITPTTPTTGIAVTDALGARGCRRG